MARKDGASDSRDSAAASVAADAPELGEGHDLIVDEAPGLGQDIEMTSPMGDRDEGDTVGSTLFEDLGTESGATDPNDLFDDMSDDGGMPAIDDQRRRASDLPFGLGDGDPTGQGGGSGGDDDGREGQDGTQPRNDADDDVDEQDGSGRDGDDDDAEQDGNSGSGDGDDDVDEGEAQDGNSGTPIPDEYGTGGEAGDLDRGALPGSGEVDPGPQPAGEAGDLIGGRGDIDFDPKLDDADGGDTIDVERLGVGVIDPLEDGSTLLGGDIGDLAEMTAEADMDDIEVDFDDLLADADFGADV